MSSDASYFNFFIVSFNLLLTSSRLLFFSWVYYAFDFHFWNMSSFCCNMVSYRLFSIANWLCRSSVSYLRSLSVWFSLFSGYWQENEKYSFALVPTHASFTFDSNMRLLMIPFSYKSLCFFSQNLVTSFSMCCNLCPYREWYSSGSYDLPPKCLESSHLNLPSTVTLELLLTDRNVLYLELPILLSSAV